MEENIKKLVENISPRSTREILEDHVKEVLIDNESKSITIIIDRKYALNQITSSDHIGNVIKGVKNSFGQDYETIIKIINHKFGRYGNEHHDREMNIPLFIHYG